MFEITPQSFNTPGTTVNIHVNFLLPESRN